MSHSNYQNLINKLDQFIRKYYVNQLIRGAIYFFSIALAAFLLVVVLEYFGQFNSQVRTVLFYSFTVLTVLVFAKYIFIPVLKILSIGKKISHEQAAKIIGTHFKEIQDKLENILQLKNGLAYGSPNLLEASINQKIFELKPITFSLAINFRENTKYFKFLAVPLSLVLFLFLFSPSIITDSTNRLVAHQKDFIPQAPFSFNIVNEKLSVFQNEDYLLKIKLTGKEFPTQLSVIANGQAFLMKKTENNLFSYNFKNVQKNIAFTLKGNEIESMKYEIKALPKPIISDFRLSLDFPKYLNKKSKTLENTGDFSAPEGTRITWLFQTNATEQLSFATADSVYDLVKISENEYRYTQTIRKSFAYQLIAKNQFVSNGDTIRYQAEVIKDKFPQIELDVKTDSAAFNVLYFSGYVKDDYGFSRLVFYSQVSRANGEKEQPMQTNIPINLSLPESDFYYTLNLSDFQLKSEDELEYYFEVWDNDGVNGSKPARTHKVTIKAPSAKELAEKEKESNQAIKEDLKENIELAKEIRADLENLKLKMLNKKTIGFQEKQLLEELLKKQKQIQNSIEKSKQQNEQKNKFQQEYSKQDEALLEKQKLLEELFDKVMTDEMKEMLAELEKMMDDLKKDDLEKTIEKMELSNEELEKELDRNLELFKQLELEKQVAEAIEKLEEIKEKQKDLKEKSLDKKSDDLANKKEQDKLNEEFKELEEKLEDIKKKNEELEEPNEMKDTDSLEEEIKKDMKESSEALEKKQSKKAAEEQESAEEKMEEMAEQLSDLQMQMESDANVENLEDLRFLLENLIHLSFEQERVMLELKQSDRNDPQYVALAQVQKKLKDDAKIIEDSLFALSKRVIQLESIVNKEITSINYNMDKAIENLGNRETPQANQRQQLSMTSINNLALLLDEAIQNMQAQMQMKGSGKGSCKKPGQGKPSPGSMKKMQEALNKQMEEMKKAMENGEKPGGKKGKKPGETGSGGQGGMSKELAQMAAKQAAIRKALKEMQEQLEGEGSGGGGQLEKLGDLMEQNEIDIVNRQITNQTILRQQEILTRLLESEKAEKEREKEEKRESKEFTEQFIRNQTNFLEYNRQKNKEVELLRTLPPSFNQFYKQKVSEYFKTLKQ
ncbi:MAG: hypothetical protein HND54_02130 [Bacteroidetes bacterium]|nr:hypothetical protein [Bacteroidota bacterium]NOG56514.1 hypothetical protein [Bacteroidota bacterium]